jgi:peroxiredoxin
LSQFLGKKNVVLFFYPRDEGPACIKEAERSEITMKPSKKIMQK